MEDSDRPEVSKAALKREIQDLKEELQQIKQQSEDTTCRNKRETSSRTFISSDKASISRRTLLHSAAGGAAGVGTAAVFSAATAETDTNTASDGPQIPTIRVGETDGGTAIADTATQRYTGTDVFDAAQQAANASLEQEGGGFSLLFEAGFYEVGTPLVFDETNAKGAQWIHIGATGIAQFGTASITGGHVLTFAPNKEDRPSERIEHVQIENLVFNHGQDGDTTGANGTEKDADGINVEETGNLRLRNVNLHGYRQALRIANIYQGEVSYMRCRHAGSAAAGKAVILVTTTQNTSSKDWWSNRTHNATNHVQFNHLQGGTVEECFIRFATPPFDGGDRGKIRGCGVHHPNVEMQRTKFLELEEQVYVDLSAPLCKNPAPLVKQTGGRINIHGGIIRSPGRLLDSSGGHTTVTGVDCTSSTARKGIIVKDGGWLTVSNCRLYGGERALWIQRSNEAVITGLNIQAPEEGAVVLKGGGPVTFADSQIMAAHTTDSKAEHPVRFENVDGLNIQNIGVSVAESSAVREAVNDEFASSDVLVRDINTRVNTTGQLAGPHADTTYRNRSGTAIINSDSTSVSVTHQLSRTPEPGDISLVPNGPLGRVSTWYLGDIGGSSFDITVDTTPRQDVEFAWHAEL
jgi:hypothetical protein